MSVCVRIRISISIRISITGTKEKPTGSPLKTTKNHENSGTLPRPEGDLRYAASGNLARLCGVYGGRKLGYRGPT